MDQALKNFILDSTKSTHITKVDLVQQLWNGYGQLLRVHLEGSEHLSMVVKYVQWPKNPHPRKVRSYLVEINWYNIWNKHCETHLQKNDFCKTPKLIASQVFKDKICLILEDLQTAGFTLRKRSLSKSELLIGVRWLANFHAIYMGEKPKELWKMGTYWHLQTRLEELQALKDPILTKKAHEWDSLLNNTEYLTFVHGDAKLDNFCFNKQGTQIAAVDFQYVGGGVGVKDLIYFLDSCSQPVSEVILQVYFKELCDTLARLQKPVNFERLERDWRALIPIATQDFARFLKGWRYA